MRIVLIISKLLHPTNISCQSILNQPKVINLVASALSIDRKLYIYDKFIQVLEQPHLLWIKKFGFRFVIVSSRSKNVLTVLQNCLSILSLIDHPLFMRGLNSSFEVYLVIIRVQPSTKSCYSRMLNLYFDFTLPRILNHDNLIIIPF